jgi:hypothetical protein
MIGNGFTIRHWQFSLPKRGERVEDYEDASAADPARGRFAIADGAAGSSFSALWAKLLVDEFVATARPQPGPWKDWLPGVQDRWKTAIGNRPNGQSSPWFVEDRIQQGAFAAFLGLVLDQYVNWRGTVKKRWQALAIGDSCLFQIRDSRLVCSVPMKRSRDFGNTPWLVGSRTVPDRKFNKLVVRQKGDWQSGDRIWLMTDALALWFLQQVETGRKAWKDLDNLVMAPEPKETFASWIEWLRKDHQIRNDDVTLMAVWV